jgi:parvulin-like peptidyl-prolyl isomerase
VALVALVVGLVLPGCGSGERPLPPGVAARAAQSVITDQTVSHWTSVAAAMRGAQRAPGGALDPPRFERCVADEAAQLRAVRRGAQRVGVGRLRQVCQAREAQLRQQTLQSLISAGWVAAEAGRERVNVSDADVTAALDRASGTRGMRQLMRKRVLSVDDVRYLLRVQLLAQALRSRATSHVPAPSENQVHDFYDHNQRMFETPARRQVLSVMTNGLPAARAARRALERGAPFARVERRYSSDPQASRQSGPQPFVQTQRPNAFETAIFQAKVGKLYGPLQTPRGVYVYRVVGAQGPSRQSFDAVRGLIRAELQRQSQQKALVRLAKEVRERWGAKTSCRSQPRGSQCAGPVSTGGRG